MKRSRVHGLTALASATLLMILLGSPAQASPWQLATESWLLGSDWFETIRVWLSGATPDERSAPPVNPIREHKVEPGKTGGLPSPGTNNDNGICLDPNGNRVTCPT